MKPRRSRCRVARFTFGVVWCCVLRAGVMCSSGLGNVSHTRKAKNSPKSPPKAPNTHKHTKEKEPHPITLAQSVSQSSHGSADCRCILRLNSFVCFLLVHGLVCPGLSCVQLQLSRLHLWSAPHNTQHTTHKTSLQRFFPFLHFLHLLHFSPPD